MTEPKNEQHTLSFKWELGYFAYTVKDIDKSFKNREQKLIINKCFEKIRNNPHHHSTNFVRGQPIIRYGENRHRRHG